MIDFAHLNFEAVDASSVCLWCPNEVSRFGRECSECIEKRATRERQESLASARAKLPESLRGARLSSPNLPKIVSALAIADATDWLYKIVHEPVRFNHTITFSGESRKGKTTLAVALLGEIIDLGSEKEHYARAKRIEFVLASDLANATNEAALGRPVFAIEKAKNASVLLLDEVGRLSRMKHDDTIFRVMHDRHRECKPTIYTTPAKNEAELAEMTGDAGFAGRVFRDAKVVVL